MYFSNTLFSKTSFFFMKVIKKFKNPYSYQKKAT